MTIETPMTAEALATAGNGRPLGINWIGLGTMVRREVSRMIRVPIQAFVAPWISALLFIFIFGFVVGSRITQIGGHRYLEFVLPGIIMLNVVNAAFLQSSSAIYFSRFVRFIEEILVAPMSYAEMIAGSLSVVVLRASITGVGILVIGLAFGATHIESWPLFLFWMVSVSGVFGLLGIIVGLWSKSFEQLNMPVVFFLTPLSMVGGVFNTVGMLPPWLRWLAWGNPFFYFINGIRGSMIGFDETPPGLGIGLTLLLLVVLGLTVWRLYAKGYGLRE
jgi:ABC-2 type transport system permease protein